MNATLCLHKGSKVLTLDDLRQFPIPAKTDTYQPYSHEEFILALRAAAQEFLVPQGYVFLQERFGANQEAHQLFGVMSFKGGDKDMGLALGFRNSYDKSLAAGLCIGASIFVCDNLAFAGDITLMRKHTLGIITDLPAQFRKAMQRAAGGFDLIRQLAERLKTIPVDVETGYRFLGWMFGRNVYGPTINNEAYRQWSNPYYDDFKVRNAWSLYNAVTGALKKLHPSEAMQVHTNVGNLFRQEF